MSGICNWDRYSFSEYNRLTGSNYIDNPHGWQANSVFFKGMQTFSGQSQLGLIEIKNYFDGTHVFKSPDWAVPWLVETTKLEDVGGQTFSDRYGNYSGSNPGWLLVRDTRIPSPSTIALLSLGLTGLSLTRRKCKRPA